MIGRCNAVTEDGIKRAIGKVVSNLGLNNPGYKPEIEFREWDQVSDIHRSNSIVRQWHRDGHPIRNLALVMWSNKTPTEFRYGRYKVRWQPLPGLIVLVRNNALMHRTPEYIQKERVFVRVAVTAPDWL